MKLSLLVSATATIVTAAAIPASTNAQLATSIFTQQKAWCAMPNGELCFLARYRRLQDLLRGCPTWHSAVKRRSAADDDEEGLAEAWKLSTP